VCSLSASKCAFAAKAYPCFSVCMHAGRQCTGGSRDRH
jgi:hypothetical protein